MRLSITHFTEYIYSSEVFLEPHQLRFRPKNTPYSHLESFHLKIEPEPAGVSEQFDADNNLVYLCWFEDVRKTLRIHASSVLNVSNYNPFNFILYPEAYTSFPFTYSPTLQQSLGPALDAMSLESAVIEYGERISSNSQHKSFEFILELTRQINLDFTLEARMTGQPHSPDITFKDRKGSCRDLAWFQIQLLRHFGFAARFVSGYYYLSAEEPEYELHAWLEVFLPGAGWIGFDPSHGLATGTSHIPVASSAYPEHTMPVTGFVRGSASSRLKTEVALHSIPSSE